MSTPLERMTGAYGSQMVTGTTKITRVFNCFSVNTDCVLTEIRFTGNSTNQLTALGLSGQTLKAGMIFFCPIDNTFSEIKLGSGSVIIH